MERSNDEPSGKDDYRTAFYAQYHRALDLKLERPSKARLNETLRQFGARWDKWLPRDRAQACLDIGCGTGEFLYFLSRRGFKNIVGVDLSAEELEVARAIGMKSVERANALDYLTRVPEQSLSLVSAFNFFEHLTKAEVIAILPAIYRALRPGGTLIAVTPNGLSPFSGATRYWDFSHEGAFTPASWRQVARLAGFREMHFEDYGPMPHSLSGVLRALAWSAVTLALVAVSYIEVGGPRDPSRVFTADMKIILRR